MFQILILLLNFLLNAKKYLVTNLEDLLNLFLEFILRKNLLILFYMVKE